MLSGLHWASLGFGALGILPAIVLESLLLPEGVISDVNEPSLAILFIGAMGIGIIEELCKFVPLGLFIFKKRYFNEHTDGILYFALAGIGFGLPESILYTLQYGSGTGIVRLILVPFFHSATTAYVGYSLARIKLRGGTRQAVLPTLLAMMVLHGLYDFGLMSKIPVLVIGSMLIGFGFTVALFVFGYRAKLDDQRVGLSVVGSNNFCRSCGEPNPRRLLYCRRCGKHA